jgi:hypothetical protein
MTRLALLAVLQGEAARTLGEPGTVQVPVAGLLGLCMPAPDLSTAEAARGAVLAQHDRLVRVALAHDLVPVRPGAVFSGRGAVAAAISAQSAAHRAHLDRIAGSVEVTLLVDVPTQVVARTEAVAAGGVAYLRARRPLAPPAASPTAEQLLADALAAVAMPLPVREQAEHGEGPASATVLVPRRQVATFLAMVGRWADTVATPVGAQVRTLGPWPCYTFATTEVDHAQS